MNPREFKIIDGRLYLNWDAKGGEEFETDAAANIQKADAVWEKLVKK